MTRSPERARIVRFWPARHKGPGQRNKRVKKAKREVHAVEADLITDAERGKPFEFVHELIAGCRAVKGEEKKQGDREASGRTADREKFEHTFFFFGNKKDSESRQKREPGQEKDHNKTLAGRNRLSFRTVRRTVLPVV